jgi:hypothetical protein
MFINDKQSTGRISRVVEITPLSPNALLYPYRVDSIKQTYKHGYIYIYKHEHTNQSYIKTNIIIIFTSVKDWGNVGALIQRHIKSGAKHHSCSVAAESFLSVSKGKTADICMQINSQYRIQIEDNRYFLACLIDALVLCRKQNIAIRGHEENKGNYLAILQYRAKSDELLQKHLNDKTKKTRYLSPKIQNELLDMSAEQIRRDIVRDCNNAACFALIADEATDSSTKEQISLC